MLEPLIPGVRIVTPRYFDLVLCAMSTEISQISWVLAGIGLLGENQAGLTPSSWHQGLEQTSDPARYPFTNTNALYKMSLRVKRSNLIQTEIATPFGLAMTM